MSHFDSDNKSVSTLGATRKLPVDHEWFDGDQSHTTNSLIPPQEEKMTSRSPGKTVLEKGVDYLDDKLADRTLKYEGNKDELPRDKAISEAVRSGAAGVTGEDLGVEEKRRIV